MRGLAVYALSEEAQSKRASGELSKEDLGKASQILDVVFADVAESLARIAVAAPAKQIPTADLKKLDAKLENARLVAGLSKLVAEGKLKPPEWPPTRRRDEQVSWSCTPCPPAACRDDLEDLIEGPDCAGIPRAAAGFLPGEPAALRGGAVTAAWLSGVGHGLVTKQGEEPPLLGCPRKRVTSTPPAERHQRRPRLAAFRTMVAVRRLAARSKVTIPADDRWYCS